ncbi:MAG: hypothetical protein JWN78_1668 [Bacteroidota bacterium]|nr:hypothetical protein [Bacteroidota bacterium]
MLYVYLINQLNMSEIKKAWLILTVMLYVVYISIMWKWGHDDMNFWMGWSQYMFHNGFTKIYDMEGCNYLPAYLYFILFHVKIQGTLTNIQDNLYSIKFYTLLFDFLGAYAAVWFVKDEYKKIFYFFFLLFNIAYIYNTALWGQVDAIFSFWGFAAIVAAIERKLIVSVLFLVIALNFKLQALVFIPVVGLLLLPHLLSKEGIKKTVYAVCICAVLQFLILFPFIIKGRLHQVIAVVKDAVDHYPYPAVGSFNFWVWMMPKDTNIGMIIDSQHFFISSYKHVGSFLLMGAAFIAVFPLMKFEYLKYFRKAEIVFPLEKIFLVSSLIPLVFFYFNTQMHERYSHPALISLAAYAFCTKRFFPLILGSVAYFLNMEKIFHYLSWTNYNTLIFEPRFVAVLYLSLILYLYYLLYSKPTDGEAYNFRMI